MNAVNHGLKLVIQFALSRYADYLCNAAAFVTHTVQAIATISAIDMKIANVSHQPAINFGVWC